jgi:anti-sigma B factor antagonist
VSSSPKNAASAARAGPSFGCSSSTNGDGAAHIRLSGELDVATAGKVTRALSDALELAREVVVDLRDLQFIDSAGVHVLVEATAAARRVSRRVLVLPAPPLVHAVFELTGTADALQIAARPLPAV